MKIEENKSTPSREKLARMYGVGGFEDAPGKMAKIGGIWDELCNQQDKLGACCTSRRYTVKGA